MPTTHESIRRNRLLAGLSEECLERLEPHAVQVELPDEAVLQEPGSPLEFSYFPTDGLASVVTSNGEDRAETCIVGFEGMLGSHVALGVKSSPQKTFVQVAGAAIRIRTDFLESAYQTDEELRRRVLLYVHVSGMQTAYTALVNARNTVDERLGRWLLMSQDRLEAAELPLKHAFISLMLGVRRPSVTNSIHVLEGAGLIRATRGCIEVVDRERLRAAARASYGGAEAEYDRVMGADKRTR